MSYKQLFTDLEQKTNTTKVNALFEASGMLNKYNALTFGFFPLGTGILDEKETIEPRQFDVMILGNDFGTDKYLTTKCADNKEKASNPTISNLTKRLKINPANTFYTNFYLGVRKDGTNTHRVVDLQKDYKELCYSFFLHQLEIINPKLVICLGHEVRRALMEHSSLFADWGSKNITLKALYENDKQVIKVHNKEFGNRTFIVIPHPCDNRNLNAHIQEILKSLGNENPNVKK